MLRYYMDQHVHRSITAGLRSRSIDCITAHEDGSADWADDRLLQRATELNRVFFSADIDSLVIAMEWIRLGRTFSGLVYTQQLWITIGLAIEELELLSHVYEESEMRNQIVRIPL